MPTLTFWCGTNCTCHIILTLRIFFKNYSNYYTFEKSKTRNKIVTIIQQNKWKKNIWHTSDCHSTTDNSYACLSEPTLLFVTTLPIPTPVILIRNLPLFNIIIFIIEDNLLLRDKLKNTCNAIQLAFFIIPIHFFSRLRSYGFHRDKKVFEMDTQ